MTIRIEKASDWEALSRDGLEVVLDPMVVRCGEIFLNGQVGAENPDQAWSVLQHNVQALGLFFDTLILEECIPVFNYQVTVPSELNFEERIFGMINQSGDILREVMVGYLQYDEVKNAALAELVKLYAGPKRIERQLAMDILNEKDAAEYKWAPSLGVLEYELPLGIEQDLARYFLGGLIFGAYAQLLGGNHVLQPKLSRLFLAASLQKPSGLQFEEALFGDLKRLARSSVTELPWRPTFFPYLLFCADTPEALLTCAMKMRESSEVRDYRAWFSAALDRWRRDGHLGPAHKEVKNIAKAIERRIAGEGAFPKVEIKVDMAGIHMPGTGVPMPSAKIDLAPTLAGLWGWTFDRLPGRGYRKLLTRAIVSDHAYLQIEHRVKSVWSAAS